MMSRTEECADLLAARLGQLEHEELGLLGRG
jgi:hypothetical protein